LPNFLSAIVILGLTQAILSPTYGLLNAIRSVFGMQSIYYLAQASSFRSIIVIIDLWKGFGWGAIIYLAAISGIDSALYEAAKIDGANRIQIMRHITLPSISNIISLLLIMNVGNIMSAGFEMIFLLQSPTVMSVADIIDIYTYRIGLLDGSYSFGTAVGLFKSVISLVLVYITNVAAKKMGGTGIW
jgi:putative aldouronate transport system permease protein